MNQLWPPDRELNQCTCTPLADDPNCSVHSVVPAGLKPLTWKQLAETSFGTLVIFVVRVTILIVLAGICSRAILWAIGLND